MRKLLLILPLLLLFGNSSFASHASGADLTYDNLGNGLYRFTLKFYRDCSGIAAPTSPIVNIKSTSCGVNTSLTLTQQSTTEVTPICPSSTSTCNGGSVPGMQQYIYTGTINLAQCTDWVFSFAESSRNAAITNSTSPDTYDLYVEATLNNVLAPNNSSPDFTNPPIPYICAGQPFNYNDGVVDANGNTLVYSLANPRSTSTTNVPYSGSFSPTYPISTTPANSFNFSTTNGQMSFTPSGNQIGIVTVKVTELNAAGQVIGTVIRDMQLIVLNCTNVPPTLSNPASLTGGTYDIPTKTFNVCAGQTLSFQLTGQDADAGQILSISSPNLTLLPGGNATLTTSGTNPTNANFNWTVPTGTVGTYNFSVTYKDNACPTISTQTIGFNIVVTGVDISTPNLTYCQTLTPTTVTINAVPNPSGGTFSWSPATGLSGTNIANPVATINASITYVVTYTLNGCVSTDTFIAGPSVSVINVNPGSANICPGQTVPITSSFTVDGVAQSTSCSYTLTMNDSYGDGWSGGSTVVINSGGTQIGSYTLATGTTSTVSFSIPSGATFQVVYTSGSFETEVSYVIKNQAGATVFSAGPSPATGTVYTGTSTCTGIASYIWSPASGLSSSNSPNPTASPAATTTYTITATNTSGCSATSTVQINVSNGGLNVTPPSSSICPGNSVQLNSNFAGTAPTCGTGGSCASSTLSTIGAANTNTGTANTTGGVGSPYQGYYSDGRVQYLLRATELTAAGVIGGPLTSLAFDVSRKASTIAYTGFTIKIGCTNLTALTTTFVAAGLSTVYTGNVTPVAGWNTYNFSTNYTWDGTANLIVEVCYDNSTYTNYDQVRYTATAYNSVAYKRVDGSTGCTMTGATTSTQRPNMRFTNCASTSYIWSPAAGLSSTTITNPVATPASSTTYGVTVSSNGCVLTGTAVINIGSSSAGPDQTICQNTSTAFATSGTGTWTPLASNPASVSIANTTSPTSSVGPFTTTGVYNFSWGAGTCLDTVQITVSPKPNAGADQNAVCYITDVATMAATGTGTWTPLAGNPGTFTITAASSPTTTITNFSGIGTYNFVWTSGSCSDTVSVIVTDLCICPNPPVVTLDQNSGTICAGVTQAISGTFSGDVNLVTPVTSGTGTFDLPNTSTSPFTFVYTPSAADSAAGTVNLLVVTDNPYGRPCVRDTDIYVLTIVTVPILNVTSAGLCGGSSATITATAQPTGGTYLWSDAGGTSASATFSPIATTTYTVTYTFSTCTAEASGTIVASTVPAPVTIRQTLCSGSSYTSPGGKIITTTSIVNDTLVSVGLCDSVIINDIFVFSTSVTASPDANICLGDSTQLSVANAGIVVSWSPTSSLDDPNSPTPIAFPATTTKYTVSSLIQAPSTIVNGDFSGGNSGFTSAYTNNQTDVTVEGTYAVITNPQTAHASFDICGDHTTGTGEMMVVNGAATAGEVVWQQTINVNPNTDYAFSAWLTNVYASNPAILQFEINGTLLGSPFSTASANCQWDQFYTPWNSGTNTVATITIVNQNTNTGGNDFALDDILFSPICLVSDTITVFVTQPTTTIVNDTICQGDSYTLPGGTEVQTANTYNDTLTGIAGCDSIIITNLTVNPVPTLSFNTPIICNGQTATLVATPDLPGGNYNWAINGLDTSTINVTPNTDTYYQVSYILNGCSVTDSGFVTVKPQPTVSVASINRCPTFAGTLVAVSSITGGTFSWNPGGATTDSITVTPALTSDYIVTYDLNGCFAIDTATFTVNLTPAIILDSLKNVSCFGANDGAVYIGLPAPGTYTYAWSNGPTSQDITGLGPNSYTVTVTDQNTCTSTASYTVNEPTVLSLNPNSQVDVTCFNGNNGTATVNPTGGTPNYTYLWSNNQTSQTAVNLIANTYSVTVKDANLCSITTSFTIIQPTQIVLGTPVLVNVLCNGGNNGSAQVPVTGGGNTPYTFLWSDNQTTNPAVNLFAGPYSVTVFDASLCAVTTTIVITEPTPVLLSTSETDVKCNGGNDGTATVSATGGAGGFSYIWDNGGTTSTITGLIANTYSVTVTDANNCTSNTSVTVNEPTALSLSATSTRETCFGFVDGTVSTVFSGGTPPYSIRLIQGTSTIAQNTSGQFNNVAPNQYIVRIVDANGCIENFNIVVPGAEENIFDIQTQATSCFGPQYKDGSITVTGLTVSNGSFTYGIDGGNQGSSGYFNNLAHGDHTVIAVDSFGCRSILDIQVAQPDPAYLYITPQNDSVDILSTLQINSDFGPYPNSSVVSYQWTPSSGLSCIDCPNPVFSSYERNNSYTLLVTYNTGCFIKANVKVVVTGTFPLFIPNAFSPNGDGNNDVYQVFSQGVKDFSLNIFNRWGEKIFESTNILETWDGSYKGNMQPPGTYVYYVDIKYLNGKKVNENGSITLIR